MEQLGFTYWERSGLYVRGLASLWEAWPPFDSLAFWEGPGLPVRGKAFLWKAGPPCKRPDLLLRGVAQPSCDTPCLSLRGPVSLWEAQPAFERPASLWMAWPSVRGLVYFLETRPPWERLRTLEYKSWGANLSQKPIKANCFCKLVFTHISKAELD